MLYNPLNREGDSNGKPIKEAVETILIKLEIKFGFIDEFKQNEYSLLQRWKFVVDRMGQGDT